MYLSEYLYKIIAINELNFKKINNYYNDNSQVTVVLRRYADCKDHNQLMIYTASNDRLPLKFQVRLEIMNCTKPAKLYTIYCIVCCTFYTIHSVYSICIV